MLFETVNPDADFLSLFGSNFGPASRVETEFTRLIFTLKNHVMFVIGKGT